MLSLSGKARAGRKASVLIVDDNVALASCLETLLEAHGFETARTVDGSGGLQSIKLMDFDVVLCDLFMPGLTGEQLHQAVRELKPHLCERFIFMSGQLETQATGLDCGTDRPVLRKPFNLRLLMEAIDSVLQQRAKKAQSSSSPQPSALTTR